MLLTHADWDHVLGVGMLPDARVIASRAAAERIASGDARESVEQEAAEFYMTVRSIGLLRVDQAVDLPRKPRWARGPRSSGRAGDTPLTAS